MRNRLSLALICLLIFISASQAQTTAFTYQGKLADNGNPVTGNYDFEFKLFDNATVGMGTQQGATVSRPNVAVTNGIFTVQLDFVACPTCFNGANRYLEISVSPAGSGAFELLSPRQQVNSNPYAIRSLNASMADGLSLACVNCVTSSQIGSVNGSAVTGTIPAASVPADSGSYIQNKTSPQASSNFNISDNGTLGGRLSANVVNVTTQYDIGGLRVLSANPAGGNFFAGVGVGGSITSGVQNAFFGHYAGELTNGGSDNSFFGSFAGRNTVGGAGNSFFGRSAGLNNAVGSNNTFVGNGAGSSNTLGANNTLLGSGANVLSNNLTFATAIGAGATINRNNQIVIGRSGGQDDVVMPGNTFITRDLSASAVNASVISTQQLLASLNVGIGTPIPAENLHVVGNSLITGNQTVNGTLAATQYNIAGNRVLAVSGSPSFLSNTFVGIQAGNANPSGIANSFFGFEAGQLTDTGGANSFFGSLAGKNNSSGANTFIGYSAGIYNETGNGNTALGYRADFGSSNLVNATAIGADAIVTQSNSLVLGSAVTKVGIGTAAPAASLHISASSTNSTDNTAHFTAPNIGPNLSHIHWGTTGDWYIRSAAGAGKVVLQDLGGNVGIGTTMPNDKLEVNGVIRFSTLGSAGGTTLCRNLSNQIANCSSSLRYKTNIAPFSSGLSFIKQLRPITFDWKQGGMKDVGFGAEDVAKINALFVTYNDKGEVEGVKYDRLSAAFVNAIKEQQAQIEAQHKQIDEQKTLINQQNLKLENQQSQLEALKILVCSQNQSAEICKPKP